MACSSSSCHHYLSASPEHSSVPSGVKSWAQASATMEHMEMVSAMLFEEVSLGTIVGRSPALYLEQSVLILFAKF